MQKYLIVAVAVLLAFLAGYVPEHLKARDSDVESAKTRERLESQIAETGARYRVSQIHGRLGMLILEAEQHNFATALQRSTALFDEVADALTDLGATAEREALAKLSKQRDSVTSALTMSSPEAVTTLKQLYSELGKVTLAEQAGQP